MTHFCSFIAEKQSVNVRYSAQVSYFTIKVIYKAFTEQVFPPALIALQYAAVRLPHAASNSWKLATNTQSVSFFKQIPSSADDEQWSILAVPVFAHVSTIATHPDPSIYTVQWVSYALHESKSNGPVAAVQSIEHAVADAAHVH